jgi:hypothetical protein
VYRCAPCSEDSAEYGGSVQARQKDNALHPILWQGCIVALHAGTQTTIMMMAQFGTATRNASWHTGLCIKPAASSFALWGMSSISSISTTSASTNYEDDSDQKDDGLISVSPQTSSGFLLIKKWSLEWWWCSCVLLLVLELL